MLALTGLVFTAVVLGHILINDLNDLAGIGLDVVTVGSVAALALLLLAWEVWLLFLSGWKWRYRVLGGSALAALPILFLSVFRPVNGGDANLMRFEPIWTSRPEPPTTTSASDAGGADLQSTSPGDYPQFLGQQQNGVIASGRRIDVSKFSESRMVWKQPIGQGWSGFAARNGFAVTMEQRGDQECVTCYEIATGRLVWMHQHPGRHRDAMNLGRVGPRSTPTIHDGNVYAVGAVGRFVCLAGATGKVIWEADLNALLGIELQSEVDSDDLAFQYEKNTSLSWGRAGSPLIVDDLVIVPGGGPEGRNRATLLAFDRLSGVLRWRNGDEMIAYGTPVLATVAGVRQVLLVTETKAMGFDPADGRTLWEQSRPGQSNGAANTSQLSLVAENRILTSKGYPDGGGELLELSVVNGALQARSLWNNTAVLKTKLTSPVLFDGHAYAISNGFLECTRLSDGERIWKRRGRFGHGQILLIGDLLLLHSEEGVLFLIQATPDEYRELGSLPTITGVCWNTLCLWNSMLLVRSELEAACLELPVL